MKKILSVALCVIMLALCVTSCSKPPEYSEIEDRLSELIEASYAVNDVLFGVGLPVYERVYENTFSVWRNTETDEVYYYYTLNDDTLGELVAYRSTEVSFYVLSDTAIDGAELIGKKGGKDCYKIEYDAGEKEKKIESKDDGGTTYYYYTIADETYGTVYEYRQQKIKYLQPLTAQKDGESAVYSANGVYYYPIDYTEKTYDFYYSGNEPEGYSYIRLDSPYYSVEQIKKFAESVYSAEYLSGVYEMLFTGGAVSDDVSGSLGARYFNYEDEDGQVWLMMSDEYASMIKSKRIYDLSTAKVVLPGSSDFVNVEIETYTEAEPSVRTTVKLSLVKQDGEWFLDSATY